MGRPYSASPNSRLVCYVLLQLISDAGHQGEITSVSTACHQIEVFSRVLRTSISTLLEGGEDALEKNLPEFTVSYLVYAANIDSGSMKIQDIYQGIFQLYRRLCKRM